MTTPDPDLSALEPLIGEWSMAARFEVAPDVDGDARVTFEWLAGGRFVVERWTIPIAEAPDGLAVIGPDPGNPGRYLQHYFDSRGVARVYRMTVAGGVWRLWREEPDLSPLDFHQRFTGVFADDGRTITAEWEIAHDGTTWEHDFDLSYTKLS